MSFFLFHFLWSHLEAPTTQPIKLVLLDTMLYFTRRNDRIEFTILILTVRTTGALWLLISQSPEHAAARAGAVYFDRS